MIISSDAENVCNKILIHVKKKTLKNGINNKFLNIKKMHMLPPQNSTYFWGNVRSFLVHVRRKTKMSTTLLWFNIVLELLDNAAG